GGTPTPKGTFYLLEIVRPIWQPYLGPYAYTTSAHSDVRCPGKCLGGDLRRRRRRRGRGGRAGLGERSHKGELGRGLPTSGKRQGEERGEEPVAPGHGHE